MLLIYIYIYFLPIVYKGGRAMFQVEDISSLVYDNIFGDWEFCLFMNIFKILNVAKIKVSWHDVPFLLFCFPSFTNPLYDCMFFAKNNYFISEIVFFIWNTIQASAYLPFFCYPAPCIFNCDFRGGFGAAVFRPAGGAVRPLLASPGTTLYIKEFNLVYKLWFKG